MRVREVMTPNPVTIDPRAPVGTAAAVMRERRLRHLPVVDDRGQLVGIVTDRDLRSAMLGPAIAEYADTAEHGRLRALAADLADVRVSHVMTWGVRTTGPEALVAQAAAVMADARVGSLPVVEGDILTIKGEKEQKKEEKDERQHRIERTYGAFVRTVRLPASVDGGKVSATFKNGVVTVTLPKAPGAKGTTIPVKAE